MYCHAFDYRLALLTNQNLVGNARARQSVSARGVWNLPFSSSTGVHIIYDMPTIASGSGSRCVHHVSLFDTDLDFNETQVYECM